MPRLTQPIPRGVLGGGNDQAPQLRRTVGVAPSIRTRVDLLERDRDRRGVGSERPACRSAARYTHRSYGRVLEDVGTLPMMAYFLPCRVARASSTSSPIPSATRRSVGGSLGARDFVRDPGPRVRRGRRSRPNRRFANNWTIQSSYRWSRLRGNFEGFFRNDNGQSDPGITSLFDFPTNDPTYVSIGVTAVGFRGDIRYLGTRGIGPLPNDRATR